MSALTACNVNTQLETQRMAHAKDVTTSKPFLLERNQRQLGGVKHFSEKEKAALAEDFIGIRTEEGLQTGLYGIESTGVSTKSLVDAANSFLYSLDAEQQTRTLFAVDDIEWRKWLNVDNGIYIRQGVSLKEMTAPQKKLAFDLLAASLSAKGLEQTKNIMKTDQTLKELNNNATYLDEELYFFTIMGKPSTTQPWGWQIDGHHLAINYFVLGDQVVFSPVFMGAEPVLTQSGKHKGNLLLQEEQDLGLTFMQSLSHEQQNQALIGEKNRENMIAAGMSDNQIVNYQGLPSTKLTPGQKIALLAIIEEYIGNMRDGHAAVKMDDVKKHLDSTYFSWRGGVSDNSVFYYRIYSPVVLIEFDHQGPVGIRNPDGSRAPTRNHIHTMLRTPNGNDYGKDLLRQHLEKHHHNNTTRDHSHSKTKKHTH